MRLDLFITFLDSQKRLSKSSRPDFEKTLRAIEDGAPAKPEPAFDVQLSDESTTTEVQKRARDVQELNEQWSDPRHAGAQQLVGKDLSLTALLPKPRTNFDTFFKKISENLSLLKDVHDEIDRDKVEQFLSPT